MSNAVSESAIDKDASPAEQKRNSVSNPDNNVATTAAATATNTAGNNGAENGIGTAQASHHLNAVDGTIPTSSSSTITVPPVVSVSDLPSVADASSVAPTSQSDQGESTEAVGKFSMIGRIRYYPLV